MSLLPRIPARAREVTQEPLLVAPRLLGAPLASFRRRLVAFVLDVALFGVVVGALFAALSAWSIQREDPGLFARVRSGLNAEDRVAGRRQAATELLRLVDRRAPGAAARRARRCWACVSPGSTDGPWAGGMPSAGPAATAPAPRRPSWASSG